MSRLLTTPVILLGGDTADPKGCDPPGPARKESRSK